MYHSSTSAVIFAYYRKNNEMKPSDFKESTITLTRPDALSDLQCDSLKAWSDGKQCITLWKPSFKERLSILLFGRVWLSVWGGNTQPPIWMDAQYTVFQRAPLAVRLSNCCDRIFAKVKTWQPRLRK